MLVLCQFFAYTQNVGVGTSTPVSKLDVEGGISVGANYSGAIAAPTNGAIIEGAVGVGTSAPDASAQLQVLAANKGLLIPNIALSATNLAAPVTAPATSLLVYNTATAGVSPNNVMPGFYYWNGTAWVKLDIAASGGGGGDWHLSGNAGTVAANNFIGTTDNIDFVTRTNNIERMRVTSAGNVGIGITTPTENLSVRNPLAPSIFSVSNSANHFFSVYSGSPGDQHVALISDNGQAIRFGQWGDLVNKTPWSERMRVDVNGRVGIGTTAPAYLLHVAGDVYANGGWFRVSGNQGLYWESWGGGFYMSDATWIRTYNNKNIWTGAGLLGSDGGLTVGYGGATPPVGGAVIAANMGIGTSTPATRLHVLGTTTNPMTLQSSTAESDINYIVPSGNWQVGTNATGNGTSGNQFYIYDNAYRLTVQRGSGNVGIGTTAPSQRVQINGGQLYVPGFANQNWGNTGTFIENFIGTGDLSWQNGTYSYCIRAEYGTIGDWFACYSDERIKKEIRPLENKAALNVLNQIELKHYKYIDYINHGNKERVGVIAQQVETVFPEAISTLKNFIPNVYQLAKSVTLNDDNKSITIETEASCECKVGDKIRIFVDKDREPRELDVIGVNGNSFTLANWQTNREEESPRQVFVFGKEISDFRGVEYDRIFLLGMAAIQELDRKTAEIGTKITELEKLKAEVEAMKADLLLLKNK